MIDETEQKFLDAALKLFTKLGYNGATTIAIAEEAGFSDKTLFRKFKTKQNLYDRVLKKNAEKYKKELDEFVFVDNKFDTHHDFLDSYIRNLAKVNLDNFEYVNLSHHDRLEVFEPVMKDRVDFVGDFIEKNIPEQKIDYKILGLTINAFVQTINTEKYHGCNDINYEEALEKFINNIIQCIPITQ